MWDSCTLQGSIKRLAVSSNQPGATPPGPNRGVSALAHNRSDPCSFCRGPLPGASSPPKFPSGADRVIALSDCRIPSADPLAGTAVCRDRRRAPSSHYRNKAGEGSSSLAFATARREVLSGFPYASSRTLHRVDPASFEVGIRTLLCFTSPFPTPPSPPPTGPCGPRRTPLLGFPKIAPPSNAAEESTPTAAFLSENSRCPKTAAEASEPAEPPLILVPSSRFSTALTAYASPTLLVCCNELPTMRFTLF